jgi:hypothetical protein
MQVLTDIGEMGVQVGERYVKFRPSLAAMARLGTPKEIVETFVTVCGAPPLSGNPVLDEPRVKAWRRDQFGHAVNVLYACTDEAIDWLVGYVNERYRYVRGALPLADIVGLAAGLLKHGVLGDIPPEATRGAKKEDYLSEFKARDFAAAAMAHLGATEAQAWDMTMTSYIIAMRAKFPPAKDAKKVPTDDEYSHVKGWLARVNKARLEAANHG